MTASHRGRSVWGLGGGLDSPHPFARWWCGVALCIAAAACAGTDPPGAGDDPSSSPSAGASSTTADTAGSSTTADTVGSPSAAEAAWAYAEELAAAGWSDEVVAEAEARAAALEGLEAEGSPEEFVPVPPKPEVRVVAFGSLDGDGRSRPVPLQGVTVVAVPSRHWDGWWSALLGVDFYNDPLPGHFDRAVGLPPGGQYRADAQQILTAPGAVISTTGADGATDLWLEPGRDYLLCALSPRTEGLIAGCERDFYPSSYEYDFGLNSGYDAAMVYFSHGRAYLGVVRDERTGRLYWFQPIAQGLFGPDLLGAPSATAATPQPRPGRATVDFYSSERVGPEPVMALIEDSHIGAWWDAISTTTADEHGRAYIPPATVESSPALLVPLKPDPTVYKDFLASVTVDAGVYLVCWLDAFAPAGIRVLICVYEEFPADSHSYLAPGSGEHYLWIQNVRGFVPDR